MKRIYLCSFIIIFIFPLMAYSQNVSSDKIKEARVYFKKGVELFSQEHFAEAAKSFEKSYEIYPHYETLGNIGATYIRLGKYKEAIGTYRRYIEEGSSKIKAKEHNVILSELERLNKLVSKLKINITPSQAKITLNGEPVERQQWLILNPGNYIIAGSLKGYTSNSKTISLNSGDLEQISLKLKVAIAERPPIFKIKSNVDLSNVYIDGNDVGKAPWEGKTEPGRHEILVSSNEYNSWKKSLTITNGTFTTFDVNLEKKFLPFSSLWTWIGLSATAIFTSCTIGLGVAALDKNSAFNDTVNQLQDPELSLTMRTQLINSGEDIADQGETLSILSDVSLGFAITSALLTGGYLLYGYLYKNESWGEVKTIDQSELQEEANENN